MGRFYSDEGFDFQGYKWEMTRAVIENRVDPRIAEKHLKDMRIITKAVEPEAERRRELRRVFVSGMYHNGMPLESHEDWALLEENTDQMSVYLLSLSAKPEFRRPPPPWLTPEQIAGTEARHQRTIERCADPHHGHYKPGISKPANGLRMPHWVCKQDDREEIHHRDTEDTEAPLVHGEDPPR